jgi:ribosomal protein S18 acetylase RimI-like enzyme
MVAITRSFHDADVPQVARIRLRSFSASDSAITLLGYKPTCRYLRWLIQDRGTLAAVCVENDGKIAGFLIGCDPTAQQQAKFAKEHFLFLAVSVLRAPLVVFKPFVRNKIIWTIQKRLSLKSLEIEEKNPALRPKSFRVLDLAVDPACQGIGIGKILMDEAERIARAMGLTHISCSARLNNSQAIKFYEKQGYKRVCEGSETLLLQKQLGPWLNNSG